MRLTVEEHGEAVRERLAKGESYRTIARDFGCHHMTVAAFVRVNFPDLRRAVVANQFTNNGEAAPEVDHKPHLKLLVIDIETRPNLAYVWDVWRQNIGTHQLIDEKDVISFAAKWVDETNVLFYSTFHDGKETMVKAAWELLDQADAVIHYNGKKFDVPHLNMEFLRADMPPPSPFRQVDLLLTVRKEFNFTHNKLDHVASKLGIGNKVEHEGFSLWLKCMADDPEAWERMKEYNIQDVLLTEKLYRRILPYINQHPSYAAVFGDKRCPNCGSADLHGNGYQHTKTGKYQRYTCGECGKHCRDTHRQSAAEVTETSSW